MWAGRCTVGFCTGYCNLTFDFELVQPVHTSQQPTFFFFFFLKMGFSVFYFLFIYFFCLFLFFSFNLSLLFSPPALSLSLSLTHSSELASSFLQQQHTKKRRKNNKTWTNVKANVVHTCNPDWFHLICCRRSSRVEDTTSPKVAGSDFFLLPFVVSGS